jgi:hypothetical protein
MQIFLHVFTVILMLLLYLFLMFLILYLDLQVHSKNANERRLTEQIQDLKTSIATRNG